MEATIFDPKVLCYQIVKNTISIGEELLEYLLGQGVAHEYFWPFIIGKQDNENTFSISRDFNQINHAFYIMEVSVQDLALWVDAGADGDRGVDWHGLWSFARASR